MSEDIGAWIARTSARASAPDALRVRLAAGGPPPPRRRRSLVPRLAVGGAVAALLAAVVLVVSSGAPTVQAVAAAALNAPQRAAADDLRVGAIRFPEYGKDFGWSRVGEREDRVSGRDATTVIYRKGAQGIHYTIIDGAPIRLPPSARTVRADGRTYAVLREGDTAMVAWHQAGHTCVLASRLVGTRDLLRFASWG